MKKNIVSLFFIIITFAFMVPKQLSWPAASAPCSWPVGLVTHYFALLERSKGLHTVPYHDLYGSMSLFGWLLALTYLVLEFYHRQRSVGAFVLPFILAFFLAAQFRAWGSPLSAAGTRPGVRLPRDAQHPRLRWLRAILCAEPDLSRRKSPAAQPQTAATWSGACPRSSFSSA